MWFYLQSADGEDILIIKVLNFGSETLRQLWARAVYEHMIVRAPSFLQSWGIVGEEVELPMAYKPDKEEPVLVRFKSLQERNDGDS
jgi:hypothetical protein